MQLHRKKQKKSTSQQRNLAFLKSPTPQSRFAAMHEKQMQRKAQEEKEEQKIVAKSAQKDDPEIPVNRLSDLKYFDVESSLSSYDSVSSDSVSFADIRQRAKMINFNSNPQMEARGAAMPTNEEHKSSPTKQKAKRRAK